MKVNNFWAILPLLIFGNAHANETETLSYNTVEFQPYVSLGVMQNKNIKIDNFHFTNQYLSADFALGLVKTTALKDSWLFSKSIEVNYVSTQFSGYFQSNNLNDNELMSLDGKYQELGLIGSVSFKKLDIFENVVPYVKASVGLINAKSQFHSPFEQKNDRQWKLGYELSTGLEFNVSEDSSISFAVGFTDDSDI